MASYRDYQADLQNIELRKELTKSAFMKCKHQILREIESEKCDRKFLTDLCAKFDSTQDAVMELLEVLSGRYEEDGKMECVAQILCEVKEIGSDYNSTLKESRYFFTKLQDTSSMDSLSAENVSVIEKSDKVLSRTLPDEAEILERQLQTEIVKAEIEVLDLRSKMEESFKIQKPDITQPTENRDAISSQTTVMTQTQASISRDSRQKDNTANNKLGSDMWKQLKRVSIPVFRGDKRVYESWKASFTACIDQAPATSEYKLLQLREHLTGDALHCIENLGHSAIAYETAKERLDRKFGGKRRQVALYLEELERFRPLRAGCSKDIERFADLLDVAVVNLKEAGRTDELKDGSLYKKLQSKMPEDMLTRFHRWIYEHSRQESVEIRREWILRESEFHTIASEAVHGIYGGNVRGVLNRTFHGEHNTYRKQFTTKCKICSGSHGALNCDKFRKLRNSGRWDVAKRHGLCFRCLGDDHRGDACSKTVECGINGCRKSHHKLLHKTEDRGMRQYVNPRNETRDSAEPRHGNENLRSHTTQSESETVHSNFAALRTVPVIVRNGSRWIRVNALLDDGSTRSYINSDVAAELGLHSKTQKVTVNVLNGKCETFQTMPVDFTVESENGYIRREVNALTTNSVTGNMQVIDWRKYAPKWQHLHGIKFPSYRNRPTVDLLLGIDYADLHYSMRDIRGRPGEPVARLTPLGWTCVGSPFAHEDSGISTNHANTFFVRQENGDESVDKLLRKFWEIEEVSGYEETSVVRPEDKQAMETAKTSLSYQNGRYEIGIPWKEGRPSLPDNYVMALKRLQNTEKRLIREPGIAKEYDAVIEQYTQKGYVQKVLTADDNRESAWYLPHFPIIRPDKTTTKTRIVFDASAAAHGVSLNDTIHKGPKLQRDLFDVLQRFRRYPVAVVCDIAEMYLQIELKPEDRSYHRFLWRSMDQEKTPTIYQFNRVVFGVNSSPFQAQFVCQQHARSFEDNFPMAAETVNKSTYMDDSLDSVKTVSQGIDLYQQLSGLWGKAGMYARKWLSNSPAVLEQIPVKDRASEVKLECDQLPKSKSLGVMWQAGDDVLTFEIQAINQDFKYTKRTFLQKIATLFDPLGLVTPFTVMAKLIMQDIWQAGIDWDEPLDEMFTSRAQQWFSELPELVNVRVPRSLQLQKTVVSSSYHTFVDASENAYGTVMYARHVYDGGEVSTRIIASKTRVAPLNYVSIPRLELMAAVLGLRLAQKVALALEASLLKIVFWSDSMNVLWWIRGRSRSFKPFVANRVGEIQAVTSPEQWRHVPTNENPADLTTRGLVASALATDDKWWYGPEYLKSSEFAWPKKDMTTKRETGEEKKAFKMQTVTTLVSSTAFETEFRLQPTRFSCWNRLVRQYGWVKRFIHNCRTSKDNRIYSELTRDELQDVENGILTEAQREAFTGEVKAATRKTEMPQGSKILNLNPTLDDTGVLRCDGRLKYAEFLPYDVRFPIILPRHHWVTQLIVMFYHEKSNHSGGTNYTLSCIAERFWIVCGREAIREYENECTECRKRKARAAKQIMAPLPQIRFKTPLRAFARTSVDYAGPFVTIQGRGQRRQKRCMCLFTCLCSRAVHLEIGYGLDTDSFLNAFYRMVNRRGLPEEMLSDNGTNFKGADRELKSLVCQLDTDKIQKSAANRGIKWTFNPPLAPHFGGVHETMVKAAKKALSAIPGNADINDEELATALTGAEALLNSRPLTYQSANPKDDVPLTPNHLLCGQIGGQFAPESVDTTSFNPMRRWRRVQELVRHFWQRWLREWLPGLNARQKWYRTQRDIQVGDIVLIISPDTQRGHWPLGRILEVYTGRDGHVRSAKIQTGSTTLVRRISKLCPLEVDAQSDGK